MVFEPD